MKKITIEKEEEIADVVERVLSESDADITLVIPKESALARSVRNFHLLKREADAAGKGISIESVDETILAFAKESGLEASHPLWRGVRGTGGVSDIIPAVTEEEEAETPKRRGKKKIPLIKLTVKDEEEEGSVAQEEEAKKEEQTVEEAQDKFFKKRNPAEFTGQYEEEEETPRRRGQRKLIWGVIGVVVVVLVVLGVMTWVFGHVVIAITFQKSPWSYQGSFTADKSVTQTTAGASSVTIPAQVFTTQKNTTQTFPASGNANVSLKAQGTITIITRTVRRRRILWRPRAL